MVTLSADGRLSYWETVSGEEIRCLSVDRHREVTAMDVDDRGERVAIGSEDSSVKVRNNTCVFGISDMSTIELRYHEMPQVWRYRQGDLSHLGRAECGRITKVRFSPSGGQVAAATEHGGIVVWTAK